MPSARNVATPQAVGCRLPCRSACAKTSIEPAAASATTRRNWPKLSSYKRRLRHGAEKLVDREGAQRLELRAAAGTERHGHLGDGRVVRRLDDVHEVERPER